jgi:hypothetical protein
MTNFNLFLKEMKRIAKGDPNPEIPYMSISIEPYFKDTNELKICVWSENKQYWFTEVITKEPLDSHLDYLFRSAYREFKKVISQKPIPQLRIIK